MIGGRWESRWGWLFIGLLCCGLGFGCAVAPVKGGGSASDTLEQMRTFEARREFAGYAACMSERGRGWLIAEMANVLLMDANIQPINPNAGEASRKILRKHQLADLVVQVREWGAQGKGPEFVCVQLSRDMGSKFPDFLRDFNAAHGPFFPQGYKVVSTNITGDSCTIDLSDPTTRQSLGDEVVLKVMFIRRGGTWLFDGGKLD